jgi:hypothetical protein
MSARLCSFSIAYLLLLIPAFAQREAVRPDPLSAVPSKTGIQWQKLFVQSSEFLTLEQGFRYATQEGTRHSHRPFFPGYVDSLRNLHGWSDGDNFLTNYIGHPMQGAVTGFIFVQNDPDFQGVVFGRDRRYWKSRLRATAWTFAYSEQFEIGPLSEASIGNVQSAFPQQGFADQVVTPAIGLAWMVGEDAIDRLLIRKLETRTTNRYARIALRAGLNPSRSLANAMAGKVPWYRETANSQSTASPAPGDYPLIPSFEFLTTARVEQIPGNSGRGTCIGGVATAAFRLSPTWQLVGDVSGCKILQLQANLSGDSLTWMVGPRKVWNPYGRLHPYVQVLAGGRKLSWEQLEPAKKARMELQAAQTGRSLDFTDHSLYTNNTESTGLALSTAAGLDVRLNSAFGLRLAEFGYTHSWNSAFNGIDYSQSLEMTSGLILRWGTW